jgi:hypothetical protein
MNERKEGITILQIVCLVAGFALVTSLARAFGYDSILASAAAGAIGALLGTLVYQLILAIRR